jgi:phosphoglycolate phosphatase
MSIRAILFDKDGTLLDYNKTWLPINRIVAATLSRGDDALAAVLLRAGGHDPDTDAITPGCDLAAGSAADIARLWAPLLVAAGQTAPDIQALTDEIDAIFSREGINSAAPVCDLAAFLDALHARGVRAGIATSDNHAAALATMSHLGVTERFDFICGYDSGHGTKPGPGMVLAFCAALGLRPHEVAMVGDNTHDLEMGRAAGAGLVVGVLTGSSTTSDLAHLADHVLPDITGLLDLV